LDAYVPDIEENIPLPANAKEAFPELTPSQELEMRANVIKLMSDLTGQPIVPSKENADEAKELAKAMTANPDYRPDFAAYPNETIAMLTGMVNQMKVSIVDDLAELKTYVITRLLLEVETAKDPKTRVTALTKLGEVDGVDAFKRRTEVTHKNQSLEEVEKELLDIVSYFKAKTIDEKSEEIEKIELDVTDVEVKE
jgi:hypothetical protein